MQTTILYTKKFELNFDAQSISKIDISNMIEEINKEYIILDSTPILQIEGNIQFVTFRVCKKDERKKIGF